MLFNDTNKTSCRNCHKGPLFFEETTHPQFTPNNFSNEHINTPSLVECWCTAPYGHLGEFHTVKEIIEIDAHTGLQQKVSSGVLTTSDIEDLAEYVLSL